MARNVMEGATPMLQSLLLANRNVKEMTISESTVRVGIKMEINFVIQPALQVEVHNRVFLK